MKHVEYISIIAVVCICVCLWKYSNTEESSPRRNAVRHLVQPLDQPYGMTEVGIWMKNTTLGQLSKTSTKIVVADVVTVRKMQAEDVNGKKDAPLSQIAKAGLLFEVVLLPVKAILDDLPEAPLKVILPIRENIGGIPQAGDHVIAFVVDYSFSRDEYVPTKGWDFHLADVKKLTNKLG